MEVAKSEAAPPDLLRKLARDDWDPVVRKVVKNPATPEDVFDKLARHADKEFRQSAAERTTSPATVRKLADDPEYKVREAIAARDDLTAELFELLASDSSVNVRLAVVRQVVCEHENATEELLERMCHDSEVSVAEAAWKALRERASDAVE